MYDVHAPCKILFTKIATKARGKKICYTFFCSHKLHKIKYYFIFQTPKKKIWANFQRIIELLLKKLSLSSQKYGFGIWDPWSEIRDPGCGKNLFWIPDPGIKKAPDPGSGFTTLLKSITLTWYSLPREASSTPGLPLQPRPCLPSSSQPSTASTPRWLAQGN